MNRILGLDFGLRRVGVAVSDPDRRIASPVEVYERRADRADSGYFRAMVEEYRVDRIVIGLPLLGHGDEGPSARLARAWGAWLSSQTGVPVWFVDERYTTVEAEELLRSGGLKASRRRSLRDMVAAQLLLQAYLDAGCPEADPPASPLDDPGQASEEGDVS
ncbi:Holliday junction resolvase RuvX [Tautonia plasticadhaerens]|uniref:Putative pre-16S rRNA nuclease n=1 Tax=Tautonia plasticadhaerens TaxID=2527974 RepID=A0A518H795_9BACT|nr:Holliday junction resolvase RuvX [Tautonia plasticadhaerens]QDV36704.1 Putative Holliday junction resolvase [Tautonia plasticadhaerens]